MYKAITKMVRLSLLPYYAVKNKKQCTRWEIAKKENGLSAIVLNSNTATGWCG